MALATITNVPLRVAAPSSPTAPSSVYTSSSSSPFGTASKYNAYLEPTSPPPLSSSPAGLKRSIAAVAEPSTAPLQQTTNDLAALDVIRLGPAGEQKLSIAPGRVLHFGRKPISKRRPRSPLPSPSDHANNTTFFVLPESTKYSSRLHCTVSMSLSELHVKAYGQNGVLVDGARVLAGAELAVPVPTAGRQSEITLDFWGWKLQLELELPRAEPIAERVDAMDGMELESELSDMVEGTPGAASRPRKRARTTTAGRSIDHSVLPPTSSPGLSALLSPDDDDTDEHSASEVASGASSPTGQRSRSRTTTHAQTTPVKALSDCSSVLSPSNLLDFDSDDEDDAPHPLSGRAQALVASRDLDLPGMVASAVVFHPRATVGTDEVVRAVLSDVRGMWDVLPASAAQESEEEKEELAVGAWWDIIQRVLEEGPFGCIENAGLRDAAGNPVPPVFYYTPESDPSRDRAAALAPFLKRVRGARLDGGGKRYFWRKPANKKK